MRRRVIVLAVLVAVAALAASTLAFGGPRGLIWDDGHYAKPGTLDDGKDLLSQTSVSLSSAVATAQRAADGGVVYMVDVGNQEVRVDATSGKVVAITPRD
jgi:hypothetical protein